MFRFEITREKRHKKFIMCDDPILTACKRVSLLSLTLELNQLLDMCAVLYAVRPSPSPASNADAPVCRGGAHNLSCYEVFLTARRPLFNVLC